MNKLLLVALLLLLPLISFSQSSKSFSILYTGIGYRIQQGRAGGHTEVEDTSSKVYMQITYDKSTSRAKIWTNKKVLLQGDILSTSLCADDCVGFLLRGGVSISLSFNNKGIFVQEKDSWMFLDYSKSETF
jgi:hypothetical protein